MLGENKGNNPLPNFVNQNLFHNPAYSTNQLQLFGVNDVNYLGTETINPTQQKLQISLNNKMYDNEVNHHATLIHNQNPVSIGLKLKLSYDDEERNSSVTSAGGSMNATSSIILAANDTLRTELERQKLEIDQYLKTQEENLIKEINEMKRRQMSSFLKAIEMSVNKKLNEKDLELETLNRKSMDLTERMKQVTNEAQQWFYRAKYNESVVNILKANIEEAMKGGNNNGQGKEEGYGDNDTDDAISYIHPNNYLNTKKSTSSSNGNNIICRNCKVKEVSIVLMPCRHLCLCKDCEGIVNVCPVCQLIPSYKVQVYMS